MNENENDIVLAVELGALVELPLSTYGHVIWEDHKRGKNWFASIAPDPQSPGGLRRTFWEKAKGDYYYMVPPGLKIGTPVEVGADYYSARGNPSRTRWYGFVVMICDASITLRHADGMTGKGACKEAAKWMENVAIPTPESTTA